MAKEVKLTMGEKEAKSRAEELFTTLYDGLLKSGKYGGFARKMRDPMFLAFLIGWNAGAMEAVDSTIAGLKAAEEHHMKVLEALQNQMLEDKGGGDGT